MASHHRLDYNLKVVIVFKKDYPLSLIEFCKKKYKSFFVSLKYGEKTPTETIIFRAIIQAMTMYKRMGLFLSWFLIVNLWFLMFHPRAFINEQNKLHKHKLRVRFVFCFHWIFEQISNFNVEYDTPIDLIRNFFISW